MNNSKATPAATLGSTPTEDKRKMTIRCVRTMTGIWRVVCLTWRAITIWHLTDPAEIERKYAEDFRRIRREYGVRTEWGANIHEE